MEELLNQLKAKGLVDANLTLEEFKKMAGGRNAKAFHNQLIDMENPMLEQSDLLSDPLKDFDTYVERFGIDTSFEIDDTKIEPLKSPYPNVDIADRPEEIDELEGDEQALFTSNIADDLALANLTKNYKAKKDKLLKDKPKNLSSMLKALELDFEEAKRNIALARSERTAFANIIPYKGTDQINPSTNSLKNINVLPEVETPQVETPTESPQKIQSKTPETGVHSWLFPELTTSWLAGQTGMVDYNTKAVNDLFTRSREDEFFYADENASDKSQNLLIDIIQAKYPGYTVRPYEKSTKDVYKKGRFGVTDYTQRAAEWPNVTGTTMIPISKFGEVGVVDQEGSGRGSEAYSYRRVDGADGNPITINGEELIITSPDGKDEISIFTEVGIGTYQGSATRSQEEEDRAIEKFLTEQKVKLANFINKHGGLDPNQVENKTASLMAKTNTILSTPVNVNNPEKGGIAPNLEQKTDLDMIGKYVGDDFVPNPMAFKTYNALVVDYILQTDPVGKGGLSEATIKKPYTIEANIELKKWATRYEQVGPEPKPEPSPYSQWITTEDNETIWVEKGDPLPSKGPRITYSGEDTPLPLEMKEDYKQVKELIESGQSNARLNPLANPYKPGVTNLSEALTNIVNGTGLKNPYKQRVWTGTVGEDYFTDYPSIGPGSGPWLKAEAELTKAYEGTGLEVPVELIMSSVAEQEWNKTYDDIISTNMTEFLWDAPNNNYVQQLLEFNQIETRDKNLIESMGLMAVNEADLQKFSGDNPVNNKVNAFEETYNNPVAKFDIDPNQPVVTLKNGKEVNESTLNDYIKARTTKYNQLQSMLQVRKKVWRLQDKADDIESNLHLLGKEYDSWNASIDALGLGFADIGSGLLYLSGKALKYTSPIAAWYWGPAAVSAATGTEWDLTEFWDEYDEWMADSYDDYARWKTKVKDKYGKEVAFHSNKYGQGGAFTNAANFGRFVGMEVGKQIPILTTMVATGGTAAPWVIGAYAAGQHWAEGDLREFHTGKAENEFIQGISAIGYGAAEGVFEALTTVPILQRGASLMKRSGAKSFLDYRNSMKQYFKENALHLASDPVLEASSEFMTSIAQNAIDGRPLLENADHAAFVGGMFGFGMSTSPFLAGAVARQFTDYNSFAEFKEKDDAIRETQKALNAMKRDGNITAEGLTQLEQSLETMRQDQRRFVANKFGAIENTMGAKAFDEFMASTRRQADLSAQANEMMRNGVSNKIIQNLKKDFDITQHVADVWRTNSNFGNTFTLLKSTDKAKYDRIWQQAKDQLAKDNNGKIRDDQIPQVAEQIYLGEQIDENFKKVSSARSTKKKKYLKFDTNGEALTYIDDVLETSKEIIQNDKTLTEEQQKAQIYELESQVRGFKDGLSEGTAMGDIASGALNGWNLMFDKRGVLTTEGSATVRNEILGFRENAIKNQDTQVFTHEASHAEFGEILGYDSIAFEPLAQDIKKYLQETHSEVWDAMVVRRGGELKYADEIVMNFLEYVGNGAIDLNNKPGKMMGSAFGFNLNNIFKKNKKSEVDLKGANGSIKYLYDLGKAISEGRVTRGMIKEYRKKAVFKEMRNNYNKAKRRAEREAKKAQGKKGLKNLQNAINNFKFSTTGQYNKAADVLKQLNELVAENKVKPVKNYIEKRDKLSAEFKRLKAESGVVEKVPVWEGAKRDSDGNWIETDAARKERVNLIERSFRGRLETFRGGLPIQEIVEAYEGKIESLFKQGGYFATDSYQGYESFQEALADFTLRVNTELMKSIRAFDATKNKDFDAYIMSPKILPNKVKLANKQIGKEFKNQGFKVGLESASGVATSENTSVQEFEKTLREIFGVEKGSPFYGAAMTAVQDVMAKGLPKFEYVQRKRKGPGKKVTLSEVRATMKTNPTGEVKRQAERDLAGIMKKVKSELQASYQTALDKSVKKEFLKAKIYDTFLKKNRPDLLARLPIDDLVQMQKMAKEKILAKVVKTNLNPTEVKKYEGSGNLTTATTTQGPTLYARLNPSEKAFVDFFNVRGRKNALAKVLSAELGLDATMQNLTSEKVVEEVSKGNPQIKEQLGEQALKDFALAIKRGTSFKFSLSQTIGMEGKLAEDYKELQPALIDQIINMEVSDPMSVKLAVDVVYADEKFAPYRTKIKGVFEKLLKPYRKAIAQEGKVDIDLLEYVQSVDFALELESIAKTWNPKWQGKSVTAAEAFANENITDYQKAAINRAAQQMLINNDNNVEQTALQFIRWQAFAQNGTDVNTKSARGMLYGDIASYKNEFLSPNFNIKNYELEGSGMERTITLEYNDGTFSEQIPFPPSPVQEVRTNMIDGSMSQTEIDFREKMAEDAWNFSVDIYKAAKQLYDNKGFDNLNMAMLMTGMGSAMKGPIRAAAPFRYAPVDIDVKTIRKGKGKLKDGVFTTKQRDLALRVQKRVNEETGIKFEYIGLPNGNIEINFKGVEKNTEKEIKKIVKEETAKNFEYEHGIPASVVNLLMVDAIFNKDSNVDLQKLKDSYAVGAIPVDMNDNLSIFFGDRMQFGYQVGDIAPMRWFNRFTRGGASYAVEDIRTGDRFGEEEAALWREQRKANQTNKFSLSNNVVDMSNLNMPEVLDYANKVDQALKNARDPNAPVKKIRVFDFDDTLATSNNVVFYTMPDGTKGQLNAEQFAKEGLNLIEQGAVMDFTDFNTVRDGGTGPLADLARTIIDKKGAEDVFVLTARAQESAQAIYEFLQSIGIKIPLENITGLGNSTGVAKAEWIIGKAAEGYNDFYFADDAIQNVQAVKAALGQIDVKSRVQQAKFKFSKNVDSDFNKILENSFGIEWYKEYSTAKGQVLGEGKGKRMVHPYSAEDFEGLLYPLLGKGKVGEANYKWFKDHLIDPYNRGVRDMNTARINLMDDFKALKNTIDGVPKILKDINETGFSNENSMRVYIWSQLGYDIPGLSKTDLKEINDLVSNNDELRVFAEQVLQISKGDYIKPDKSWLGGTMSTDFIDVLNDVKRKDFLSEFIENSDIIFSDKNMAKLEAALGPKYVEAVRNILARMKSGTNRLQSQNRIANGILDYLNNAQGVVLFFNMRSALLQGISSANFINWSSNNIYKAGKAFANQKQYWSDFIRLMNSDYLVDRRNGLKMNINENEIANLTKTSKNKAKAVISYIIEKGYIPTKFMDSFAIASGGATYFRNRTNDLIENEGLTKEEAEAQAYEEFVELAEKSQQSSDPSKISSQQASDLGRIFLNWANTQMQYLRIQKKATQDIINRRGNDLENASKIIYYGVIQNLWFQAAHAAVFALAFGDADEDEEFKESKILDTANGMTDNILRGLGISGQVVSVLKNTAINIYERSGRSRPEYTDAAWELVRLSPVISSKVSRVKQALWQFDSKKRRQEMIDKGFSIDNPAYMATAKIISAVTNIPIDRLLLKMENVMAATSAETETWMKIALLLGWPEWVLKPKEKKKSKPKWGETTKKQKPKWGSGGYKSKRKWGEPATTN